MRSLRYTLIIQGSVLLTVLAGVAAIVAFSVAPGGTQRAQAGLPTPIPTPAQTSASIEASACDTKAGPSKCLVPADLPFTISLSLNSIDGLPDLNGDTVAGYSGILYDLTFGSTSVLEVTGEQWIWPPCEFSTPTNAPPLYSSPCVIDKSAGESLYTGVMLDLEVNCIGDANAQETVTITEVFLVDGHGSGLPIKAVGEGLTIICLGPVGGVAELPDVANAPLGVQESPGASAALFAGIAAVIAACAVALGGVAWYAKRRR